MDTEEHLRTIYRRLDALEANRRADSTDQIIRDAARAADPRIPEDCCWSTGMPCLPGLAIETPTNTRDMQCTEEIVGSEVIHCILRKGHAGSHLASATAFGGIFTWTWPGRDSSTTEHWRARALLAERKVLEQALCKFDGCTEEQLKGRRRT